ncbi:MAG: hypothetical protein PF483_12595, partial [Halothiobacillus sp.]|nr:hypothetical protein [Halothiobacillus sp.]
MGYFTFLRNFFALLFLLLFAAAPASSGEPSRDDVLREISRRLPSGASISEFQFKNFPSSQTGSGRTAILVRYYFKENYYRRSSSFSDLVINYVKNRSVPNTWITELKRAVRARYEKPIGTFYEISDRSGDFHTREGQLYYQEQVRGFKFIRPTGSRFILHAPKGTKQGDMPADAVILGSQEHRDLKAVVSDEFIKLKESKRVSKIGFSLYSIDQLLYLLDNRVEFDLLQFP